jgi:predicted Fe-Mo cluster-binding NifX family protein/DNA-directed RNA polymerase subunit RPC12/RpoP
MEKVAIAGKNDGGLYDDISENFGRCSAFCIAEIDSGKIVSASGIRNSSADFPGSAGTIAAGQVLNMGVSAVIAGRFGPGSTLVLHRSGVRQYEIRDMAIRDGLDLLLEGRVECLDCSETLENMIIQNRFRKGNRMNWTNLKRGDEHYICPDCGCMMPKKIISGEEGMVCPNCGNKMN